MDKITYYQNIIITLLEEYASVKPANLMEQEYQIVADTTRNHFQLLSLGWHKNRHFCHIIVHLDIKSNGRIWLQVNNTDWNVAESLMEKGVPKSDIVLGTLAPNLRAYSGFATA